MADLGRTTPERDGLGSASGFAQGDCPENVHEVSSPELRVRLDDVLAAIESAYVKYPDREPWDKRYVWYASEYRDRLRQAMDTLRTQSGHPTPENGMVEPNE